MARINDIESYTPVVPALVVVPFGAAWCEPHAEPVVLDHPEIRKRLCTRGPVILCHGSATARRLELDHFPSFDLLELFAFVRPA